MTLAATLALCTGLLLPGESYGFPNDRLTLDLRKLRSIEWVETDVPAGVFDTAVRCYGRFGSLELEMTMRRDATTSARWLPHDVLGLVQKESRDSDPDFVFPRRMAVTADAGKVSYLVIGIDEGARGDGPRQARMAICGVTEGAKYVIEIRTEGPLGERSVRSLTDWIAGALDYDGPVDDTDWTEAELSWVWQRAAPAGLGVDFDVLRTEHYVILTDADLPDDFAKPMEVCHDLIEDVFPAPDLEGYRLLPVVLFRSKSAYLESYVKLHPGATDEEAARTGGFCENDYYITFYESDDPRENVYLASQQYVRNRHWMVDGGQWFRVGLGKYLEATERSREAFARRFREQGHVPLDSFMFMRTFALTSEAKDQYGENLARTFYDQAGALVEFFVESKAMRKHYAEFFALVGNLMSDARPRLERALREVYDMDLAELDARFVDYWEKR